jgi:hypothetical protein
MTIEVYKTKKLEISRLVENIDSDVLSNISVTSPYFALKNIRVVDEFIYANFNVELFEPDEIMPITAAEVGRHMAILGSLALSKSNPKKERHYYLATDAVIVRKSDVESQGPFLTGCVRTESINRKNGTVSGSLFDEESNLIFEVEIQYTILHSHLFERMFSPFKVESCEKVVGNPYVENVRFVSMELGMQSCKASIGTVLPEHCPGHFSNYPALPVARIGTAMGKIAAAHFMYLNPGIHKRYNICRADLHANQLVFTGEEVKFRTEIADPNPEKGMIFRVIAYTDKTDYLAESLLHFHY